MEPALKDGDVVLVRKSNFVFIHSCKVYVQHYLPSLGSFFDLDSSLPPSYSSSSTLESDHDHPNRHHGSGMTDLEMEQIIKQVDASAGKYPYFFFDHLNPLPGTVVIFHSPIEFPNFYHVKRVIGLGGQRVRPSQKPRQIQVIPSYSLWVEGDNKEKSQDSRTYGAISKKHILGQAERLIWPPSRWGRIERIPPPMGRAWWI